MCIFPYTALHISLHPLEGKYPADWGGQIVRTGEWKKRSKKMYDNSQGPIHCVRSCTLSPNCGTTVTLPKNQSVEEQNAASRTPWVWMYTFLRLQIASKVKAQPPR
jgi:hypothetical protein